MRKLRGESANQSNLVYPEYNHFISLGVFFLNYDNNKWRSKGGPCTKTRLEVTETLVEKNRCLFWCCRAR